MEIANLNDTPISLPTTPCIVLPSKLRPKIETPAIANARSSSGSTMSSILANCTISTAGNVWIGIPTNTTAMSVQVKGWINL